MTIKEIYNIGVEKAIGVDFRGKEKVNELLAKKKVAFNKLSAKEQEFLIKSLCKPLCRFSHFKYRKR